MSANVVVFRAGLSDYHDKVIARWVDRFRKAAPYSKDGFAIIGEAYIAGLSDEFEAALGRKPAPILRLPGRT